MVAILVKEVVTALLLYTAKGCGAKMIFPKFDTICFYLYVPFFPVMRIVNFPNCEGLHLFCNEARFFAPRPRKVIKS